MEIMAEMGVREGGQGYKSPHPPTKTDRGSSADARKIGKEVGQSKLLLMKGMGKSSTFGIRYMFISDNIQTKTYASKSNNRKR